MKRAQLEAYRDGELSGFVRWRFERRLRRDPEARRALAELDALGSWLCEADAAEPGVDLWESIRMRLPAADARLAEAEQARAEAPSWRRPAGYLALGGAALGGAAFALLLSFESAPPLGFESAPAPSATPAGSVRWIDARGHPTMVLRDDAGATIIWVADSDI